MRVSRLLPYVAAAALLWPRARAQIVPPTPPPVRHGGYGSAPAPAAPRTAASPAAMPTPVMTTWLDEAQQHLAQCAEEVLNRSNEVDATWKNAEERIDAATRELLRKGGFSESDIGTYYKPPKTPADYSALYRGFYANAESILTHAKLQDVSNPPVFSGQADPCYKFGNKAAVSETLDALDRDMAVYRCCDGIIADLLGQIVERDAHFRFLSADENRNHGVEAQVETEGDSGPYDDPANTAERAKVEPLEYRDRMLIGRTGVSGNATLIRDYSLCGWEVDLIRGLPAFGEFARLAGRRTYAVARRTDAIVALAEVVRRTHVNIQELARRSEAVAMDPLVQRWYINPGDFLDFYQRQAVALGVHLTGWYLRRGATEEELDSVDRQIKASDSVDAQFHSEMQQEAALEQQIVPLQFRDLDLFGEVQYLEGRRDQLALSGDSAGSAALTAQIDALNRQETALATTTGVLLKQDAALEKLDDAKADAANFVLPDTTLRVAWVEFDFAAEPEPRKDANPTFPLMGAPVHNWYLRNVPETTLGVRTVVRMYFTLEKGDPPATQSLTLSLGGVTAPLTLYLGFNGYLSADLILASAGTGGTGTTSR